MTAVEIVRGRVNWMPRSSNRPYLELLVNRLPKLDEYRFEKRGDLYFAEVDGVCRFYSWRGRPDSGFGGRAFDLTMRDGSVERFVGPWSSGTTAMNEAGFPPSLPCSITDDPAVMERGHTFFASAVIAELVHRHVDKIEATVFPATTYAARWGIREDVVFPVGARVELMRVLQAGRVAQDASDEQSGVGWGSARNSFEPIVRLPSGKSFVKGE